MTNQRGLTILELIIGLGVTVIIAFMGFSALNMIGRQSVQMRQMLESETDQSVAERIVMSDLRFAGLSFNTVIQEDDSGLQFFDFEPDRPLTAMRTRPQTRTLTLSLDGKRDFFLLQQKLRAGPVMIYDPVAAYDVGDAPADINKPAPLTFVSVNRKSWVQDQRPNFWHDGEFLMLDTPAMLRPVRNGEVDMTVTPRSPVFIGRVQGESLVREEAIWERVRFIEPVTERQLSSADDFFRLLPPIAGALPLVRLRAVDFKRYSLEPHPQKKNVAQLIRYSLSGSETEKRFLVADDVARVVFERRSITQKLIYFKIERVKARLDRGE